MRRSRRCCYGASSTSNRLYGRSSIYRSGNAQDLVFHTPNISPTSTLSTRSDSYTTITTSTIHSTIYGHLRHHLQEDSPLSAAMAILDILNKPMFASRFKLPLHLTTGILVIIVIGLSVPRLFMKNQPRTRAGTIALGMVLTRPAHIVSSR